MGRDVSILFAKIKMSNSIEIVTETIKADQIKGEIPIITDLLAKHGCSLVHVTFGRACNLEHDNLYKQILINVKSLQSFIEGSVNQNIYRYGESDLWINSIDQSAIFQLSHDSRIYLITNDKTFLQNIRSTWISKGFFVYTRMAKQWIPWTSARISAN